MAKEDEEAQMATVLLAEALASPKFHLKQIRKASGLKFANLLRSFATTGSDPAECIIKDGGHYSAAYEAFKINQDPVTKSWFRNHLPVLLRQAGQLTTSGTCNVLGIGSGEGDKDLAILEVLGEHLKGSGATKPVVFNRAVEPITKAVDVFKITAENWRRSHKDLMDVEFDWFCGSWQDYRREIPATNQWNVIHFIQSIYNASSDTQLEVTLRHCYERELADKGIILLVLVALDSFFGRFFASGLHSMPSGFTAFTSDSVVRVAENNGWPFIHECFSWTYDARELFDETSIKGNLLMDFLTMTTNFRSVAEKEKVEKVLDFWKNEAKESEDGKRILHANVGAVVIYKY